VPLTSSAAGDTLLLRFRGRSFPTWSAVDVLRGTLPKDALRNRAVLLGFTYLTHDVSPTPFDGSAPGLEVHATAVDNLLANDVMRRAPAWADALWALCLGLLAALSFSRIGLQRASLRVLVPMLLFVVTAVVAQAAFTRGVWLAFAAPATTAVLASSAALVTAYVSEGVERRRLRKAFAHYLADEIIDELMSNPQALTLGGARRQVTLLFSDIRGFTTLSEKMAPEALSRFLNAYLTPMTQAVLSERGFVDKYIGDALMAVFGAPAPSQDHPDRALGAAVRMHQELGKLRISLDADLDIGVGINTGEAVAGNMGSAERFDYTVIGDAVNLASRLEGLTKKYGVFCIVGDDTKKLAAPHFQFREIDRVRVKGRSQPVAIHQLLAGPGHVIAACVDVDEWHAALTAFRDGDFVAAHAAFASHAQKNPDDEVARLFMTRLAALPTTAPSGWDGVLDHHEK
jgi:adenylate cyclase